MKGSWKGDFEKTVTGLVYVALGVAIVYVFIKYRYTDYNIIGAFIGAGGLFVARKGLSYYKPDRYMQQYQQIQQSTQQYQQPQQYNPLSPIQNEGQEFEQNQTISPKSSY